MTVDQLRFSFQEGVIFRLRTLFETFGYSLYKMNKFEEYDLYAKNKDFLLSDSVITFTDFGGKLMALKPDVTLSIVKNTSDDVQSLQKLYYNENVYRVDQGGHSFKEMKQVGLECIGAVDDFCILEILTLAAHSLKTISNECILDVSHLGILTDVLTSVGICGNRQDKALRFIAEKNIHELDAYCISCGVAQERVQWLNQLLMCTGSPYMVLPKIRELLLGNVDIAATDRMIAVFSALQGSGLEEIFRFDFSAVDDIRYYNGTVFKGFIHGVPNSVLSGGQYDRLMQKMYRKSSAIGFAVYIDRLERLESSESQFDVDTVLIYDETTPMKSVMAYAGRLRETGVSVMVQHKIPQTVRCRQRIEMKNGEVEIFENDA